MQRQQLSQRPDYFEINPESPLARGLVFAGLGGGARSLKYVDSSPYGNHGTLAASDVSWSTYFGRSGLEFADADEDYVTLDRIWPMNGPLTIAAHVWNEDASWPRLACREWMPLNGESSGQSGIQICRQEDSELTFVRRSASGNMCLKRTASGILVRNYHHVCATWDGTSGGSGATIYLDGTDAGSAVSTGSGTPDAITETRVGFACNSFGGGDTHRAFDVLAWDRVLTLSEIQQLADPGNVMLSGLVSPPRRRFYPVISGGAPPATIIPRIMHHRRLMGVS